MKEWRHLDNETIFTGEGNERNGHFTSPSCVFAGGFSKPKRSEMEQPKEQPNHQVNEHLAALESPSYDQHLIVLANDLELLRHLSSSVHGHLNVPYHSKYLSPLAFTHFVFLSLRSIPPL